MSLSAHTPLATRRGRIDVMNIAYEIKSLIFAHVDLDGFKTLRLLSKSWAVVGYEFILLATFRVDSHAAAMSRLFAISTGSLSRKAAQTITTISCGSSHWSNIYLQPILSNQHTYPQCSRSDYPVTTLEQRAITALENKISMTLSYRTRTPTMDMKLDVMHQLHEATLLRAAYPKLYNHMRLLFAQQEHLQDDLSSQRLRQESSEFATLLLATADSGLRVQHLYHDQLSTAFFSKLTQRMSLKYLLPTFFAKLKSLNLAIREDDTAREPLTIEGGPFLKSLEWMLSSLHSLESLFVSFSTHKRMPFNFLRLPPNPNLLELSLSGILLDPAKLFVFLERNGRAVQHLSIGYSELADGSKMWKLCLAELRDRVGTRLRKFQLHGLNTGTSVSDNLFTLPIYKPDWTDETGLDFLERTKQIEGFVLRGEQWPSDI